MQADDGQSTSRLNVAITVTDVAETRAVIHGFDGDGLSDILLQQDSTGNCYLWTMSDQWSTNKTSLKGYSYIGWTPGPDWRAVGTGDFNADGHSDILLQNKTYGDCYIWETDGKGLIDYGYVGWRPGPDWVAKAIADFNGDGYSDILLQNKNDGACYVWEQNGKATIASGYVGWTPTAEWQVKGAADFDGDGRADILLQSANNGSCYLWSPGELDHSPIAYGYVGGGSNVNWQVKGVADFNGDHKIDILLQNIQDGSCIITDMDGRTKLSSGSVGWTPSAEWQVKSTGDYNGDGKADILLQSVNNGDCYLWCVNDHDKPLVDAGFVGWSPGTSWVVSL